MKDTNYFIEKFSNRKKIYSIMGDDEINTEYWASYPIGRKWYDGKYWWIRTDGGRKKLEKDDELLQPFIPLFCPKCKKIMRRKEDEASYVLRGHCYLCELDESAEKEFKIKTKKV